MNKILFLCFLFFSFCVIIFPAGCTDPPELVDPRSAFKANPELVKVAPGIIDEASGIADSKINPGYIWVEQDSGAPPELALIDKAGNFVKKIPLKNAENRDWEDMAIGTGPEEGIPYIYIAEIGDNSRKHAQSYFYRFPEPRMTTDTIFNWEKISFIYPDSPRDAEAFLLDSNTKDIFIITKTETKSRIYKLAYPQSITAVNTAVLVGELPFKGVVSAAISNDGTEIIIKTYKKLYYWKKLKEEGIETILSNKPILLGYKKERQGEAICFANNDSSFFTLSEKPMFSSTASLQCYRRIQK